MFWNICHNYWLGEIVKRISTISQESFWAYLTISPVPRLCGTGKMPRSCSIECLYYPLLIAPRKIPEITWRWAQYWRLKFGSVVVYFAHVKTTIPSGRVSRPTWPGSYKHALICFCTITMQWVPLVTKIRCSVNCLNDTSPSHVFTQ